MKIYLFSRPRVLPAAEDLAELMRTIDGTGLEFKVNKEFALTISELTSRTIPESQTYDVLQPDMDCGKAIMVSYGGDGTFLEAVRRLSGNPMPIVSINSGHLGFIASASRQAIAKIFDDIKKGNFTTERRSMLEVEGSFETRPAFPYAFNEFSIQRADAGMLYVDTFADGQMVAKYVGDGVILSTPSGSTAYSLSVGGPIIAPDCNCFVLSPIAPHNLTMRPIVIPDTTEIKFMVSTRCDTATVTLDNRTYKVKNGATFCLSKAKKSVFLAKFQNISFFDTLRNKMMWGVDPRQK